MRATRHGARAVAVLLFFGSSNVALPVTISVDTTADVVAEDDGVTSLREAVLFANAQTGESCSIQLGAGTYGLSVAGSGEDAGMTGDLNIHGQITILGAGTTNSVIDGGGIDRIFSVADEGMATLCDLTVQGGAATVGAGLLNRGVLILERCCVRDNGATFYGGGIEQLGGVLWIKRSAIVNNTGGGPGAGGIDVIGGVTELLNSTVSQNSSRLGAGLYLENGSVFLIFSTLANNDAQERGGGLLTEALPGSLYVANTIVGGNTAPNSPDVEGTISSQGYNLIENGEGCGGLAVTDLVGVDPGFSSLTCNGGPTATHALTAGSPAINGGNPEAQLEPDDTDQRGEGYPRKIGVRADIGAFEFPDPDEDGDGIPDEWEMKYGLDPLDPADAAGDEDGDEARNIDEYVADTVPTNDTSFQSIAQIEAYDGLALVSFKSTPSRQYRLQSCESWNPSVWMSLGSWVDGQPHLTTLADAAPAAMRQYRVVVRKP